VSKKIAIINKLCLDREKPFYAKKLISDLKTYFNADIYFSDYKGHIAEIMSNNTDSDIIISVGGDGTIAEIVNNMDFGSQTLAIVPVGRGNSLARHLGVKAIPKALKAIERAKKTKIDVIDCIFKMRDGERIKKYAVTTTGIGYTARTVDFANKNLKKLNSLSYIISACFHVFGQKVIPAKITIDDEEEKETDFTILSVNNAKYGGSLCLFPEASLNDGLIDIFYARTNAFIQTIANLEIVTQFFFFNPGVMDKVKKIKISLKDPAELMLDGEMFGPIEEITYSIADKKLCILS